MAEENSVKDFLEAPFQMEFSHRKIKTKEIKTIKEKINIKESARIWHKTGKNYLQNVSNDSIFDAQLRTKYISTTWI